MSEHTTLSKQIEKINAQLRAYGRQAVQEIKMVKNGQVIGQVRYGFKPQYVFDAVNNVLQPENWRYEVVSKEIFDNQVVAEVKLFIRVQESEWLCKGSQIGQMGIVKKNVGDAYKGAITDALQKCFSLLSIGSDAYKGLLKDVYLGKRQAAPRRPQQSKPSSPSKQPATKPTVQTTPCPHCGFESEDEEHCQACGKMKDNDLPKIAGITYQRINGKVVAVGNSFDKKELLKSAGFRWDGKGKHWYKEVSTSVQ